MRETFTKTNWILLLRIDHYQLENSEALRFFLRAITLCHLLTVLFLDSSQCEALRGD